ASSRGSLTSAPSTDWRVSRMSAIIAPMTVAADPDLHAERRAEVRAFMEDPVYPNERALLAEDDAADALIAELQREAKNAGVWAPHLPPEAGGSGSGFMEYAHLNEEIG